MKILFSGGGTGGHFFPIIAIAEELNRLATEQKYVDLELFYMAPEAYNERALFENRIKFIRVTAGKLRPYFSLLNFIDMFKVGFGVLVACWKVFRLYPDVVVGKGGYASFPILFAARLWGIPVIIHESDSIPGRVNLWAGKFAKRIAVSYEEAVSYFPKSRTAWTGNPIRRAIARPVHTGAHEYLKLQKDIPVILVLGGSLGSAKINDTLVESLPELTAKYQIIHQTGKNNFKEIDDWSKLVLDKQPFAERYKPFAFLNDPAMAMAAGIASLVISRGGSTIFEIAQWGIPSIIIPIPKAVSHDQESNALLYARSGASVLLMEENLSPHILQAEISRIIDNPALWTKMKEATMRWGVKNAAETIAKEIIELASEHE